MSRLTKQLMIEVKAISTQMRTLSVHMQSNYLDLCFILPY